MFISIAAQWNKYGNEEIIVKNYVIKSNICYSKSSNEICIVENGYLVCEEHKCAGVYKELPEKYKIFPLLDYSGQ